MDVVLTSEGLAAIQAATPGHVAAVRETFIGRLSAQDLATLDRLSATVIDELHNPSHCPAQGTGLQAARPPDLMFPVCLRQGCSAERGARRKSSSAATGGGHKRHR
jgi:hypothetical protein